MNIDIKYRPGMSLAQVGLNPGESVVAESGAMVGMSTNVQMTTGMSNQGGGGFLGGIMKAAGRKLFGGESFFRNTFTAHGAAGEVLLAHQLPGDMVVTEVPQGGLFVQSSSFIASSQGVEVNVEVGGFKSFFAGEGMFVLRASAFQPGQALIFGSFGGIQELVCDGSLVIDTGHLVAWDTTLTYNVTKAGSGWIASFLSGEGLVCQFQGQGRIWIQTRNPSGFGQAIGALLPPRVS